MDTQREDRSLDWWKNMWTEGHSPWHKDTPNTNLVEYFGQCANGNREAVALVPLCGKSLDMKWLYDQGCLVFGVDVSERAIEAFYNEHGMAYSRINQSPEFVLYTNEDERLKMFYGDFFNFSKDVAGCQFDFIWDRAAFVALNISDRKRYAATLEKLLLPTGRILLNTCNFDPSAWSGQPHCVTPEAITEVFGSKFHINHLNTEDALTPSRKERFGLDWMTESCHMLSLKQ